MIICEVVGHVWATKKEESLSGLKLMVVRQLDEHDAPTGRTSVAADVVGAGIGEKVLVEDIPVDAAIVGIIDSVEA